MRGDAPFESFSGVPSRSRIERQELIELAVAVHRQRSPRKLGQRRLVFRNDRRENNAHMAILTVSGLSHTCCCTSRRDVSCSAGHFGPPTGRLGSANAKLGVAKRVTGVVAPCHGAQARLGLRGGGRFAFCPLTLSRRLQSFAIRHGPSAGRPTARAGGTGLLRRTIASDATHGAAGNASEGVGSA